MSFGKPFITSCQSRYFRQICHSCKIKSPTVNMPLFVISFEYLAKPLWFGILAIFAIIYLYRLNLPFSHNHYLYKRPVFVVSFKFCQTCDRLLQKFDDYTKNGIFVKTLLSTCLVCHLIWILTNLKWIGAQFAMFVIIAICQVTLFIISL